MYIKTNIFLTIKQFSEKYPWPTERGLRCLIFDAKRGKNALNPSFKRINKRVIIDEEMFWQIIRKESSNNLVKKTKKKIT